MHTFLYCLPITGINITKLSEATYQRESTFFFGYLIKFLFIKDLNVILW